MKKKIFFLTLILFEFSFGQSIPEKYQRAKIFYSQAEELKELNSLGIAVDHVTHKQGVFVISDFSVSEIETAKNAGFSVEILIENSKEYFIERNSLNLSPQSSVNCEDSNSSNYETPENFSLGSMGGYFTYQEVLDQLDLMKTLYPELITEKENISDYLTEGEPDSSTTPPIGGNGIKWVKISDHPGDSSEQEPQILYTAIHHAREPNSLSQLIFYMWYLLENYNTDLEIKSIVDNTELFFVPVVNPDGYLYNEKTDPNGGGFWRKNRKNGNGVDNNRNYNYFIGGDPTNGIWSGEGTSNDPNSNIYHGTDAFSEVENQAIKWLCEQHNFKIALNNHSYSNLLLFPYGYTDNAPTPENELFEAMTNELVSKNGYENIISSELYPASGVSDDFMYGTVGTHDKIYALTPEIGSEFWPPSSQIEEIAKDMMYLNITAAKMVNNYAVLKNNSSQYLGENLTVEQNFNLKNLGINGSGNFTVSINPISSNIISVENPISFSNLEFLQEINESISYDLNSDTEPGDLVSFEVLVNNGNFDQTITLNKIYGNLIPVFIDNGNSVTDNYINNGWAVTGSTFVSPTTSITDSPTSDYQNNQNKSIRLSENINLINANGANVTFFAKWEIENDWDYVQFEVSTDNGNSWIPQCGLYTNEGSSNDGQPTGEPLYDGVQSDWIQEEIDLNDFIGEEIKIRFQFESDGAVGADGFYFDDLTINVLDDGSLNNPTVNLVPFNIYPNPVNDELFIDTPLLDYELSVFNIHGQLLVSNANYSASQTLNFSDFPSGIYLLKIISQTKVTVFKIIKK
ncbi:M14 family zinc carboxypeptidase [Flavobacteriaceae bacterium]|nr:M14 family zinc carboxypeptidase [Flavobacteriaceae bacterium]